MVNGRELLSSSISRGAVPYPLERRWPAFESFQSVLLSAVMLAKVVVYGSWDNWCNPTVLLPAGDSGSDEAVISLPPGRCVDLQHPMRPTSLSTLSQCPNSLPLHLVGMFKFRVCSEWMLVPDVLSRSFIAIRIFRLPVRF